MSICAERVAIFKAVSLGKKREDFVKIAVAGGPQNKEWQFCSPCGTCRQVIFEFAESDFEVVYLDKKGIIRSSPIEALLPEGFRVQSP